jgi:hypothetical protein
VGRHIQPRTESVVMPSSGLKSCSCYGFQELKSVENLRMQFQSGLIANQAELYINSLACARSPYQTTQHGSTTSRHNKTNVQHICIIAVTTALDLSYQPKQHAFRC